MDKLKYKNTIKGIAQTLKRIIIIIEAIINPNFNLFSDILNVSNFNAIRRKLLTSSTDIKKQSPEIK